MIRGILPGVRIHSLHSPAKINPEYLASRRGDVGGSDRTDHRIGSEAGGTIGLSQLVKRSRGLRVTAVGPKHGPAICGAGREGCHESCSYWAARFGNPNISYVCV